MPHKPVFLEGAIQYLNLQKGFTVVDGTVGGGGHTMEILKHIGPEGRFIGLDRDSQRIDDCARRFQNFPHARFFKENFSHLDQVLHRLNIPQVDAVILDVGFSSDQLEDKDRGFSFERPGPLDMRMDIEQKLKARDLVNELSVEALEQIFRNYGNERWAKRFARAIVERRKTASIETTDQLVNVLEEALPRGLRFRKGNRPGWARRHPATRVFQALRMAVNDELEALEKGLPVIWKRLKPGGRLVVITFHSGEDRIVKFHFRHWAQSGQGRLLIKKPLRPSFKERTENPRSRSAKLRAIEKLLLEINIEHRR